ncbi:MAG: NAD-dependent epimerase/dehydratase family protein [Planctomycetaceae bacterium]|nr:NAD-dependent epimerase/dehydratase family protein [Planctomycetaceae bacterium]
MTYLVTGGSGLLGNNIVRALLDQGVRVRVMVRESTDLTPFEGLDVEQAIADLRDGAAISRCVDGVDCVIHAAADIHIGWSNLEQQRLINVEGTRLIAQAARHADARMVHVSSVDALAAGSRDTRINEDDPVGPKVPCTYVVTKREAETAVIDEQSKGLRANIVNPGFMLGPWDWKPSSGQMILAIAQRWVPIAPVGGMSVCDVRDVAKAIIQIPEQDQMGRRYILAGTNITYLDAWRLFAQVTNRPAPKFRMGPLIRWGAGMGGDLVTRLTGQEGEVNSALIRMSSLFHYYDSTRACQELNYKIRPIEQTVSDAWSWLQQHNQAQA